MAGAFLFLNLGYGVLNKSNANFAATIGDSMPNVLNLVLKNCKYIRSENPCFVIILDLFAKISSG
jgi:hypothetical protein